MDGLRQSAIQRATQCRTFGIILGTLGRQGNPAIVQRIIQALQTAPLLAATGGDDDKMRRRRHFVLLLSEITPAKLQLLSASTDCWVQVACPRLSVDWGHCLSSQPVLSPYELFVCLEQTPWRESYPMDYYSATGGPWTNYYESNKEWQLLRQGCKK